MSEPVTPQNAAGLGEFGQFRKVATTRISLFTVPPGTPFETPEGLKAEDEECRVAFDVQGGVYPIRESVFQQSYAPDTLSEKPGLDAVRRAEDAVIGAARDLNVTMPDMGDGDPLRALDDALTALNDAERAALGSTDSEGRYTGFAYSATNPPTSTSRVATSTEQRESPE